MSRPGSYARSEAPSEVPADDTWHVRAIEDVYDDLETFEAGLGSEDAERRLDREGPNELEAEDVRFVSENHPGAENLDRV